MIQNTNPTPTITVADARPRINYARRKEPAIRILRS